MLAERTHVADIAELSMAVHAQKLTGAETGEGWGAAHPTDRLHHGPM